MSGRSTPCDPLVAHEQPGELLALPAPAMVVVPQVEPERSPRWHPCWSSAGMPLRGLEHLVVTLSALTPDGDFGGATADGSPRWAQAKRIGDRWVVEVQDGQSAWPSVVVPAEGDDAIFASLSVAAGALWSHQAVAGVIWSWLAGSLPNGYAMVEAAPG